ncbi:endo-1,4-beta-xylanase [Bdellovibrio bacteriovorus W]|nr:endo-1,4-beta-xylanase [Bdellovibrio bacteriovorus W]
MDIFKILSVSLSAFLVSNSVWAQSEEFRVPVESHHCAKNASYKVHLTFDDGPKIPETIQVLDTLKRHGIKATFFISTSRFKNLAQGKAPTANERRLLQVIERMKEEGHTVGSHSYEHIEHGNLNKHSKADIMQNLQASYRVIDRLGLPSPVPFRFPYGSGWLVDNNPTNQSMNDFVTREIKSKGYRPFHWDMDTWDWSKVKRQALPKSLLEQVCSHGGGVALMHDIHKWTADNLDSIIQSIQQSGHTFASEEEIIRYSDRHPRGTLVSLKDRAGSIRSCGRKNSDLDQIWADCNEYQQKSSDNNRKGVN